MQNLIRRYLLLAFALLAPAETSFGAVVGYYNLPLYAGDNLIANQLDNGANTLSSLFLPGNTPFGTTFTKWDSLANSFLPVSTFTASGWSIDYSLNFGEGGVLHSFSSWTNTFVGQVSDVILGGTHAWLPNYANGLHLISSPLPLSGNMDTMFTNVTGRLPQDGEWVQVLNASDQTYTTTTFHIGSGWDNTAVAIQVGQSAWFNLGPVSVPEPAAVSLVGLSLLIPKFIRRARVRTQSS